MYQNEITNNFESNYITHHSEIVNSFRQAMQDAGINYSGEIVPDGKLHRIRIEGHKQGTLNCAYVLHVDGGRPAGYFENWKTGTKQTWKSSGHVSKVSHAFSSQQINQAKLQREAEIRQRHAEAAIKARYIWSKSNPATHQEDHSYLLNKHIQPHGARLYKDALVIPIFDQADELVNLQFISPEGGKRFLSGGKKRGCFHIIGGLSERILISEGFSTGASLYEDSGQRVVVAFDAGNLLPVAKNIRELSPDTEIIICGDNDLSGIGQTKAKEAALAIGGKVKVLIPPIAGMDWNDVLTGGCCHE